MSYSQKNEEAVIAEATADIKAGTFLDVGAFDGKTFSNTLALVERGWSGVLVEPGIEAFAALLRTHGSKEKLSLVQAIVGCEQSIVKFWDCGDLYSTTEVANRKKWESYCKAQGKPFKPPYYLPQISVAELLKKFAGPYDVLSIDTEGTSITLLYQFMKLMYADPPRVIVVEHDGNEQACLAVVGAQYEVAERNAENLVLVRRTNGRR